MTYTTDKPKEPGYYWAKSFCHQWKDGRWVKELDSEEIILKVEKGVGELVAHEFNYEQDFPLSDYVWGDKIKND